MFGAFLSVVRLPPVYCYTITTYLFSYTEICSHPTQIIKRNSMSWIHEFFKLWVFFSSGMKFKVPLNQWISLPTHALPVLKKESPSLTYLWQYLCSVFCPFCPCKGRGSTSHIINTSSSFIRTTVTLPPAHSLPHTCCSAFRTNARPSSKSHHLG